MITPEYLKKGDTIGIVSSARKIYKFELTPSIDKLTEWGLNVMLSDNVDVACNQFAGDDEFRAASFQKLLDDDSVKAILCARGGYGTIRIIEKLNFDKFIKNPKWIIGYSDVTVLHSYIQSKLGIETIHATMPINFPFNGKDIPSTDSLKNVLFGNNPEYSLEKSILNRSGEAGGEIVGGNLSVLYSLTGTKYDIETKDKILFIEDLDEYLYHIDRMMMNLKLNGKFEGLKGLVVGWMSDMHDNQVPFGKNAYEIIADVVSEYDFPVAFNFPCGHSDPNNAIFLGRKVELNVNKGTSKINFV